MKILSSFLIILLYLSNSVVGQTSGTKNKVQTAIDNFAAQEALTHASISFQVIDLENESVVAEYDPHRTLPTASTAKLFSTATALEILGANYRPKTRVYYDGTIDSNGVLIGNIWIRGGGDPSLGSKYFNDGSYRVGFLESWVKQLKAKGIKSIQGNIIADASEFGYEGAPDGWNWVDMGNYYGAGPSGLTIFDNLVQYHFSTSKSIGRTSTIKKILPTVPGMVFHNYVKSSSHQGDNAYIYGAPYSLDRFASGTLPAGRSSFLVKGSLPDPERQFAHEFQQILVQSEIPVSGEIKTAREMETFSKQADYDGRQLVIEHLGKPIRDIVNKTNEKSINLFAEHLVCLVGYKKTGNGSIASGLKELEKYWTNKFNSHGMHVNDGSGLSRSNAISAADFTGLLKAMHKGKNSEKFHASLPVAGVNGTMRNICKGQAGHNRIQAKSGSMSRIKSYAGYVNSSTGKTYAFALIVNNQTCSSRELVRKMEVIFNKIATL